MIWIHFKEFNMYMYSGIKRLNSNILKIWQAVGFLSCFVKQMKIEVFCNFCKNVTIYKVNELYHSLEQHYMTDTFKFSVKIIELFPF